MHIHTIRTAPLTSTDFAPFGQVIGRDELNVEARDGEMLKLDILTKEFEPIDIKSFNRHFKATQAQFSLDAKPFVIVVAPPSVELTSVDDLETVRAFTCDSSLGYNLKIGTWHAGGYPIMERVQLINLQGDNPAVDIEIRNIADEFGVTVQLRL